METSQFEYDLPPERIAQTPAEPRDSSRLMVVHRASRQIEHRTFREVTGYLRPGDLLVMNQTRVIPARLFGKKAATGGKVEFLLLSRRDELTWEALTRGKGLQPGTRIHFDAAGAGPQGLSAEIVAVTGSGSRVVRFDRPVEPLLHEMGEVPLPPYIHVPLADPERYQTVYGRIEGSVAASTAGLHFTPELLVDLHRLGVELAFVTLHIGLDTFRPVKEVRIEDHQIHTEWVEVTAPTAEQVNRARLEGRRVIAVGTTVVRSLESAAEGCEPGGTACPWRTLSAFSGPTGLYIYPGHRFRAVDAMITNFHLPRSTLLMLVSAFAGHELILEAYGQAIQEGYRFFSFGDAMLIV
ncbi:MAG TPA: tRNA preQ1(34) S-adenosylmethionine ribosyltransferase-isomerase QueA [Anaerolineae bacterium]|nr:tRNA preQ1(34) S-adenosylmethionine ribosyltransferase-isomerase QueA [Anaerolineae bacterium]